MKKLVPIVSLALLIVAGVIFRAQLAAFGQRAYAVIDPQLSAIRDKLPSTRATEHAPRTTLTASGAIEAATLDIASPAGGRIATLYVVEGQQVAAGDLIAEMDTALLDAEFSQAQAVVAVTEAQLAQLKAGAREADLAAARAGVTQAEAARDAAKTAWEDALALVDAPNDLDVKIAGAAAAAQAAAEQVTAAQAAATAADLEQALWGRIVKMLGEGFDVRLPIPGGGTQHVDAPAERLSTAQLQWNLASQKTWQTHAQTAVALAARDAAGQTLAVLRSQRADPQSLRAQADAAGATYGIAAAAVGTAQAAVDVIQAGASVEQIAALQALVDQAAAAIEAPLARKAQARIVAPQAGVVTAIVRRAGEVTGAGAAIVRLADLSEVTLTVYVPETQLAQVQVGGTAQVVVDSLPGRTLAGKVTTIAASAEFTPKNVQTSEERAKLVFPVKIILANPDGALKPGMPADAHFGDTGIGGQGDTETRRQGDTGIGGQGDTETKRQGDTGIGGSGNAATQGQGDTGNVTASPRLPVTASPRLPVTASPRLPVTASPRLPVPVSRFSGTIEATEVAAAAELGGRIVAVHGAEGDQVAAGQALAELDAQELTARRGQAEAAVAAARAELARVSAAPQAARLAQAQAQVKQAEAMLAGAHTAAENARTLRENPQELDAQISAARSQVKTAAAAVEFARAAVKAAQVLQESLADPGSDEDKTRRAMYDQQVIAAEAGVRAAEAQQRGAQAVLAQLLAIRGKPVALDAAVRRAEGEIAKSEAAAAVARAVLAQIQAPVQPEALLVARAKVAQAEASVHQIDVTLEKLRIKSPAGGTITVQSIHAGEVAQPGAALYTIADLGQLKLVVYVPTGQIGQVRLGQPAEVTVDTYPDRTFPGHVVRVADQAEFTPKNVQTQEERVKTVFAVEIALDNPEGALKAGMPADAVLTP